MNRLLRSFATGCGAGLPRGPRFRAALVASLVAFLPTLAAQVVITEVMSSSGGTADWFEITNLGTATVDLTGFRMDDNSFTFASSVALSGVTALAPGQSAVFIESSAAATDIAAFRLFWGGIDGIAIGSYTGSGVSLSATSDGVVLFTSGGSEVTRVSFGAATAGLTFGYDVATSTFGGLSVAGTGGAFVSANAIGNVGSPGAIPEPATFALTAGVLALVAAWGGRRKPR